jgi:hypothetical protein
MHQGVSRKAGKARGAIDCCFANVRPETAKREVRFLQRLMLFRYQSARGPTTTPGRKKAPHSAGQVGSTAAESG